MTREKTTRGKTDPVMSDSDVYAIVNLLRGGLPLKVASKALGYNWNLVRKHLKKQGIKTLNVRATAKRHKDSAINNVYDAIDLALEGAIPEVIYLMTGVTIRQVISVWTEMDTLLPPKEDQSAMVA